jgi:hypothetical protein
MKPLLLLLVSALVVVSQPVRLDFDRATNHTGGITYSLQYWPQAGGTTNRIPLGTNTSLHLTNGPWGILNFNAIATAYNTNGAVVTPIDSNPSNGVIATNRPSAPLRLRVTDEDTSVYIEGTFNGGITWKPLAYVTNEPAVILGSMQHMMLRAKQIKPPPLPSP